MLIEDLEGPDRGGALEGPAELVAPGLQLRGQRGVEAAAGHDDLHVLAQVGAGARQVEALDLDLRVDRQRRGERPPLPADGRVLPHFALNSNGILPKPGPVTSWARKWAPVTEKAGSSFRVPSVKAMSMPFPSTLAMRNWTGGVGAVGLDLGSFFTKPSAMAWGEKVPLRSRETRMWPSSSSTEASSSWFFLSEYFAPWKASRPSDKPSFPPNGMLTLRISSEPSSRRRPRFSPLVARDRTVTESTANRAGPPCSAILISVTVTVPSQPASPPFSLVIR